MKNETREELDDYYANAGSWADERNQALRASRRVAWVVAGVAAAIAMFEALALLLLMPLKTVEPYTLLVDRHTGFVEALNPIDKRKISPDAALTQSFLVQYVLAREGFDISTVQSDFKKVALWSAGAARNDYVTFMQASNPMSPLARLPRSTIIAARVKSVSPLSKQTMLVRLETVQQNKNGAEQNVQNWVAVITYNYSDKPMAAEDRYINPLGFQVTRYRKNAEALPREDAAAIQPNSMDALMPQPIAPTAPAAGLSLPQPSSMELQR